MLAKKIFVQQFRSLGNNARFMSSKVVENELVLTKEVNDKGLLILNRPKALNSLNLEMLAQLTNIINTWKDTKSMIIVKGNGGKAFCAGGDVRKIVQSDISYGTELSKIEYTLNHTIAHLKIPYVALIDKIVMGGGVGISVHGKYRVATEKTVFAMPETSIGLFPDIGASYFLPKLQGKLGFYLGLTGLSLKGHDVMHSGIATHFCDSTKIHDLERNLLNLQNVDEMFDVINYFCNKKIPTFSLSPNIDRINECFNATSVEEILEKLEKDGSEWATKTIHRLRTVSPTSLKVTFRQLSLGEHLSLGECLQMEYRLAYHFLKDSDFYEGVRALLIGKDKKPNFNPQRIEDISAERVQSFFEPLPNNDVLPIGETAHVSS